MYALFSGFRSLRKPAFLLRALTLLLAAIVVTGCSTSFSPANAPYDNTTPGGLSGNVHGGRQPIVGAQIYLLEAGTGGNAGPSIAASAANLSRSLLLNSKASGYQTSKNTTGSPSTNPLYGDYYVSTDSTGSFSVSGEYTCTQGMQVYLYSVGGVTGGNTTANPAAGLMAVLGQCPASGTFVGDVNYVYMNEISTVAAAYAIAGYASDAVHVSSSNSALAQVGIANAFSNASNLYDISARTAGLVANTEPVGKNGTVPQTTIHALANSLAACVNSTSSTSAQCGTNLFDEVESAGASGTVATDTATEAIYIAHNPQTNVSTVFNNTSAIGTPWEPTLGTAPNDWTVGIVFTDDSLDAPQGLAIDAEGNAWVSNSSGDTVTEFSPLGKVLSPAGGYTGSGMSGPEGIVIDASGYVWIANSGASLVSRLYGSNAVTPNKPGDAATGFTSGCSDSSLVSSHALAVTAAGKVWATGTNHTADVEFNSTCTAPFTADTSTDFGYGVAVDIAGDIWIANDNKNDISLLENSSTGASLGDFTHSGVSGPHSTAVDASGNVWVGDGNGVISKIYGSNAVTPNVTGDNFTGSPFTGGLTSANEEFMWGIAIDGAGMVWANLTDASKTTYIFLFDGAGTYLSGSKGLGSQWVGSGNTQAGLAIDGSGNIWLPAADSTLTELVGAASPVVTPIVANLLSPYGTAAVNRP